MSCDPQVVILCGGQGIRLRAYAENQPKALVLIGGKPVIWHVMKMFSSQGFRDFVLALGYGGTEIIRYFETYRLENSIYTLSLGSESSHSFLTRLPEDEREWKITFVHTGEATNSGGRLKRLQPYLQGDRFLAAYTDGLADIPIHELLTHHAALGLDATLTTVNMPTNFGVVGSQSSIVTQFCEKPVTSMHVNAGFFALERSIFRYIDGDEDVLECTVLNRLVQKRQLAAFHHTGFWHCMDTRKDVLALQALWDSGKPPWKTWA